MDAAGAGAAAGAAGVEDALPAVEAGLDPASLGGKVHISFCSS